MTIKFTNPAKTKGIVLLGAKPQDEKFVNELASEARSIKEMQIWKLLIEHSQAAANMRMFRDCKNYDDIYFAKALLYNTDVIKQKLENISRIKN